MDFSVQIRGTADVRAALTAAMARRQAVATAAVQKAAFDCQAIAQQNAPVDTGFLKNSIHTEQLGEAHYQVIVGAYYGLYVELGHHSRSGSFVPARPFLFPAYVQVSKQLIPILRRIAEP